MSYDPATYQTAAKDALLSQNACNLSGIMYSMTRVSDALSARRRWLGEGTEWFNKHPIMYLFAAQIGHLTGCSMSADSFLDYSKAHDICEKIADGKIPEGY